MSLASTVTVPANGTATITWHGGSFIAASDTELSLSYSFESVSTPLGSVTASAPLQTRAGIGTLTATNATGSAAELLVAKTFRRNHS